MLKKPSSGIVFAVPGIIFIAIGVLIVDEPTILEWLVAAAFIVIGVGLVYLANFVRKFGAWMQNLHT